MPQTARSSFAVEFKRFGQYDAEARQQLFTGKNSRFTLIFEAFAIRVLQACEIRPLPDSGAGLLRLSWHSAHRILERAIERAVCAVIIGPLPSNEPERDKSNANLPYHHGSTNVRMPINISLICCHTLPMRVSD
jgi:hypothetical protein